MLDKTEIYGRLLPLTVSREKLKQNDIPFIAVADVTASFFTYEETEWGGWKKKPINREMMEESLLTEKMMLELALENWTAGRYDINRTAFHLFFDWDNRAYYIPHSIYNVEYTCNLGKYSESGNLKEVVGRFRELNREYIVPCERLSENIFRVNNGFMEVVKI